MHTKGGLFWVLGMHGGMHSVRESQARRLDGEILPNPAGLERGTLADAGQLPVNFPDSPALPRPFRDAPGLPVCTVHTPSRGLIAVFVAGLGFGLSTFTNWWRWAMTHLQLRPLRAHHCQLALRQVAADQDAKRPRRISPAGPPMEPRVSPARVFGHRVLLPGLRRKRAATG